MLTFKTPLPKRPTELIIWYAVALHLAWGAALISGGEKLVIPALQDLRWLGAPSVGALCLGAAAVAGIAALRPPSLFCLCLLLPQQAMLMIAASEAIELIHKSAGSPGAIIEAARQTRNLVLALLHTWAILRPFTGSR